jgi:glycosyltransferase involved in cell wall biosynthesis
MQTPTGRRILMLLENNPYPQDVRVRQEAEALVASGYGVSVVCPRASDQPWRELLDGVCVYRFPAPPPANGLLGYVWEYSYSMAAIFLLSIVVWLREGFDAIHAHNPPDTLVLLAVPYKLLGRRILFDHHDLAPELYWARFEGGGNRLVRRVLILCERLACRFADHVICTNESYKLVDMQRGRVPEEHITVVRNGPALREFERAERHPGVHKDGRTVVGYAGAMATQDGVDHLMLALRHLVYELGRSDVLCLLVGAGVAMAGSQLLAEELGLAGHVLFTGWVGRADVVRYLSVADICVAPEPSNPYNDRCTTIKMMEYMALGKPIVAFDLPEHRVTAQDAAAYAHPNDEFDFAQQIALLMSDATRREAMGQLGRERIERELAWCYSVPNLLDAYLRILQ